VQVATKEGDVEVIREGLTFNRYFTTEGRHPFDDVEWETRDAVIPNFKEGGFAFEQRDVEFPISWSQNATNIVAQKYFRGTLGTPQRESSVRQLTGRVVDTIRVWGERNGYFATEQDADVFAEELTHLVVNQKAAFNSPVWFNVGVPGTPQQCSACFILAVEDHMSSILNWYVEEGTIFKGGSGSGINLSQIRSSRESLAGGGTASGPVSFMRGADASAGTIKSGGKTRRAAKMVCLDIDHPEVMGFINWKVEEEKKVGALIAAGYPSDYEGEAYMTVAGQNSNNSVRIPNDFFKVLEEDGDWELKARTNGKTMKKIPAREVWNQINYAAWRCADPGTQYDTTINEWHTCPQGGRINASNPCSEYMFLDNTACNLASANLMKFFDAGKNAFDVEGFAYTCRLWTVVLEVSVLMAQFPSKEVAQLSYDYRTLGLGFANLGTVLMVSGIPYDSEAARGIAGAVRRRAGQCATAHPRRPPVASGRLALRLAARRPVSEGHFPRSFPERSDWFRLCTHGCGASGG
jgi:ribonucleoside-diphosphate reductase alpha chain